MSAQVQAPGERKTRRAITKLLKTEGPVDSAQLAERLGLTAMAVRQHLYALQREGLVTSEERPVPIGRPAKFWRLTREADRLFPEAYAELSVALIDSVKDAFGEEGLERVLTSRCARQRTDYSKRIKPGISLERKLRELAKVRTEEGYMAEIRKQDDGSFLLVENHCPICAAANACQGFCSTELDLFRSVLGPGVSVERAEHIIKGDQRCVYRVREEFLPQRRKGAK
ncbi:MAG TPA: metalloregulator ArsR/SmtB family transcription factor [Pyrinomonadaceae bacterium]|jgi:predicted ArsR family transcriptional regulator|nr:metalloregulator ArsR/SmtB family transcription factor [Pyrinomonadaceae bacterium]